MTWNTFDFKSGRTMIGRRMGKVLEGDRFECALCSGTGILRGSKGIKCSVCRGEGLVHLKGPVIVCAYCRGRGEDQPRTNITCTVCRGKGLISITKPIEEWTPCNHCKGTGAEPGNKLPCLKCKGKGVLQGGG